MITHESIWHAIDVMAAKKGMTVCELAKKAGLDESTFNPSKRISRSGRLRWPSQETINMALDATGMSMYEFAQIVDGFRK